MIKNMRASIKEHAEKKLGRPLNKNEILFVESRNSLTSLEMINDTVIHSDLLELELYLNSESK